MNDVEKSRVLCVDDEPGVLQALACQLGGAFSVTTAIGGPAGLERLKQDRNFAVIVSDLSMPEMDGIAFLGWARQFVPDAVRVLFTGNTDLDSAIEAVNEGQIFRFLRKPCTPSVIRKCVEAAVEQNRLVTSERVLLEQTFSGSIRALTDVLAVTDPRSFGRATRIRKIASELAARLGMRDLWKIEAAAMLSQLGAISLPGDTVEKLHQGQKLTDRENAMVARMPTVTEGLLGHIPRLEDVCAIISRASTSVLRSPSAGEDARRQYVDRGGQIVRVAVDFDTLEARGASASLAVDTLRSRQNPYDPEVLEALAAIRCGSTAREEVREMPVADLKVGMTLAEDLRMAGGVLLAANGYEVTAGFVERVRNFRPGTVKERVIVRVAMDLVGAP